MADILTMTPKIIINPLQRVCGKIKHPQTAKTSKPPSTFSSQAASLHWVKRLKIVKAKTEKPFRVLDKRQCSMSCASVVGMDILSLAVKLSRLSLRAKI